MAPAAGSSSQEARSSPAFDQSEPANQAGDQVLTKADQEALTNVPASGAGTKGSATEASVSDGRSDPLIGAVLSGKYKVEKCLASSDTSALYLAEQILIERPVAIRFLVASDIQSLKRFQSEARLASGLSHANIVRVFDFGVSPQGRPFLVMDYINGMNLGQIIAVDGCVLVDRFLRLFIQVCDALNYAHKQGFVHKYLQPSNILVFDHEGRVDVAQITDFGIARRLSIGGQDVPDLVKRGYVFGNPRYLSPEQCIGGRIDHRTDIYSLGCIMYESLCGLPATSGTTPGEIMERQMTKSARPFDEIRPGHTIPLHLQNIVFKCLQKDPDLRYQNIVDVWTELEIIQHGRPKPAAAPADNAHEFWHGVFQAARMARMKTRRLLLAAIVGLLGIGIGVFMAATSTLFEAPPAPPSKITWQQLNNEGEQHFKKGEFGEAEKSFGAALAKAEAFEKDDPRLAATLNNLGVLYYRLNLYPEAKNALERALAIREKAKETDPVALAQSLNDLAMVYCIQDRVAEAEPLVKKALSIRKSHLTEETEEMAQSLEVLAMLAHRHGQPMQARNSLQKSLFIRKKVLGVDHPDVARTLNELGMQHQLSGELFQARKCYEDSLDITRKTFNTSHPLAADSIVGLATLDFLSGNQNSAAHLFRDALAIRKKTLGEDNLKVGEALSCLAILLEKEGKYSEAERYIAQSLTIEEQALGPEHSEVGSTLHNFARILRRNGKSSEAEKIEERADLITIKHARR